ncbi:glycosyltransferase family protein [Phenylobacterium deserti]|uniref:Spore protein YkvP/CgeB glycosyl transferase-like domain-containing protein n=1 Tax=Phenylobacterium deserti TaxID=1914756 RepID=A0A328A8E5_9CAUL|nr:glycosyltransferase [Phenylobacterium deserti]RAK50739.1 hypothetical protein DJ018_18515 [Phenylobacterium deserti]
MLRILLLQTLAAGHIYSRFGLALQRELTELGHEAVICDLSGYASDPAAAPVKLAAEMERTVFDAAVSFSSFYSAASLPDGGLLFDALGVKFVGWQLDHPIYARQSLAPPLQERCAIYAQPSHMRYAAAAGVTGKAVVMLPGADQPTHEPRPHAEREWPVFVAATFNGEPRLPWEDFEDGPTKRLLRETLARLMDAREPSVISAFEEAVARLKLDMRLGRSAELDEVLRKFFCEALTYVRHLDRLRTIRAVAESGARLTICGDGWEDVLGRRENVTYVGSVQFSELPELYGNARVVLNLNGANGACERAIQGAAAGAAVVSDQSSSLDQLLGGGDGVAFFNRTKPATAAHVVSRLLGGEAERMGARARQKVLQSGLWRHRAAQLAALIQA